MEARDSDKVSISPARENYISVSWLWLLKIILFFKEFSGHLESFRNLIEREMNATGDLSGIYQL